MAIDVNALGAYVDEQRLPLIKKAVIGSKSASLFNLQTGVKNKAKLNLLSTAGCFRSQRYKNLKAIHNSFIWWSATPKVVLEVKDTKI